jgi:DNA repair protein RadC
MELKKVFIGEAVVEYKPAEVTEELQIRSSNQAYKMFKDIIGNEVHERELFLVAYLNRGHKVLWTEIMHIGGITGTLVDKRLILKKALVGNCTAIILAHNHPSGAKQPSENDRKMTKQIKEACDLLDISLLDHIIVCSDGYYSFADNAERSLS